MAKSNQSISNKGQQKTRSISERAAAIAVASASEHVDRSDNISIVTYADSTERGTGNNIDQSLSGGDKPSLFQRMTGLIPRVTDVSPDTLQANLSRFLKAMEKSLSDVPTQIAHYRLEEIEVAVEVSAEGEVSLLGNGGKVGGKGTLTLKLKR